MQLDKYQEQALQSNVRLIEAGPGAGKTRTIVERFIAQAKKTESGIALISFTNVAADEARERCAPYMLEYPHFVGTVDAFLHRYIVTPLFIRRYGFAPRYVRSWDEIIHSSIGVTKGEIPLDYFQSDFTDNEEIFFHIVKGANRFANAYLSHVTKSVEDNLVDIAKRKLERYFSNGLISCDQARVYANLYLRQEEELRRVLACRFSEVIIDEFQDCSSIEIGIAELLAKSGIHVVTVGDPYQNIYEFRGTSTSFYKQYKDSILKRYPSNEVKLSKNYRSIEKICVFISKLRMTDLMVASEKEVQGELAVLIGDDEEQLQRFNELLRRYGIDREKAIVLAHSTKQAHILSGRNKDANIGEISSRPLSRMMRALLMMKSATNSHELHESIQIAIRAILNVYTWDESDHLSPSDKLAKLGTDEVQIRYMLKKLLITFSSEENFYSREVFSEEIQHQLEGTLLNSREMSDKSIRRLFPKIWAKDWSIGKAAWLDVNNRTKIPCSQIHGVKGREFDAVLISVQNDKGRTPIWEMNPNDVLSDKNEELRVFYVGASRAKYILAIGVDSKGADRFIDWISKLGLKEGEDFHIYGSLQGTLDGIK